MFTVILRGVTGKIGPMLVAEYMHCFNTANTQSPGTEAVLIQNSIRDILNLTYHKQCLQAGSKSCSAGCCSNK